VVQQAFSEAKASKIIRQPNVNINRQTLLSSTPSDFRGKENHKRIPTRRTGHQNAELSLAKMKSAVSKIYGGYANNHPLLFTCRKRQVKGETDSAWNMRLGYLTAKISIWMTLVFIGLLAEYPGCAAPGLLEVFSSVHRCVHDCLDRMDNEEEQVRKFCTEICWDVSILAVGVRIFICIVRGIDLLSKAFYGIQTP
jgi:hypothetical protein